MENFVFNFGVNFLLLMGKVFDIDRFWKNYFYFDIKLFFEYYKILVDELLYYKGKLVNWDLWICLLEVFLFYEYL